MPSSMVINPDLSLIREVKRAGGENLKKCYQCSTCTVVCNLSPADKPFPRKEMIWAQWGQRDKLMADPDIWLCYQCNDCSTYCPRGARPGDVLAATRDYLYKSFAFPSFMGKALANPKALLPLLAVPVVILIAAVLFFAPKTPAGDYIFLSSSMIDFDYFLRHSFVDGFFVLGNIVIFLFAAIGFRRFWKGLTANGEPIRMKFIPAFISTYFEILGHARFNKCEANKARYWGHLLLFFGFVGAMITTGCIFVFIFIPHYLNLLGLESLHSFFTVPIELPNPVKILGALSGIGLVVGGGWLILRRWTNRDDVGANGYADYLFLYMLFFVGLTGMLSWLTRLSGVAMLAYAVYFLHLLVVYFLLWYMPYSKFAHMFYRTLALTYAKMIGRAPRDK